MSLGSGAASQHGAKKPPLTANWAPVSSKNCGVVWAIVSSGPEGGVVANATSGSSRSILSA